MVVTIRVTTNVNKIINDFKKKSAKLETGSVDALNATVETGKKVSYQLAPKDSGKTARAIKAAKVSSKNKRKVATVIARNGHPEKRWKGDKFNLTYWMHYSNKAPSHIRTGEARFMFKAGEIMKRELNKNFRKLISGL